MTGSKGHSQKISRILDQVEEAADAGGAVSVAAIVERLGRRSFAPLMLLIGVVMVSPASGIPGLPSMSGILVALISAQMAFGRRSLWLPAWIGRRTLPAERLQKVVDFLRRPVGWIEPHLHARITALAEWPANLVALAVVFAMAVVQPVLEIVPMLASTTGLAFALFSAGILIRDGLLVLAGYLWVGGCVAVFLALFWF